MKSLALGILTEITYKYIVLNFEKECSYLFHQIKTNKNLHSKILNKKHLKMELTFLRAEITSHSHYRETWLDRKYPGRDRSKRASFSTHESAMEYG